MSINIQKIRADFPILEQTMQGKPLVYLDNSNTTQKPRAVIRAIDRYYREDNANIHRSVYSLSEQATALFEATRDKIQQFIHAKHRQEIIFVKGATEGINLVANSFAQCQLKPNDEILISGMEHHSNIVPWQMVCERYGAKLRVIPISDQGELELNAVEALLMPKTRLLAITHVSNVLGTINPLAELIRLAHEHGVPVLVDGAQAVPHMAVDVQQLDCDFYVFSSHKMYGPTGVGVVYGKTQWLEKMPPYQGGGGMIEQVSFTATTYAGLPYKFEAGTANIADVIGLGAAVDYLQQIGLDKIQAHEHRLLRYATEKLQTLPGLRIIGAAPEKAAVVSFTLDDIHPHDVGSILNTQGVAIRVGHHCAMPLMDRFGVPATARASFGLYNTFKEVDVLVEGLEAVRNIFKV